MKDLILRSGRRAIGRALGIGLALTVVLSTMASALNIGSVEGVWGIPGAADTVWATGPGDGFTASTDQSSESISTQNSVLDDENHVRYGAPIESSGAEAKSGLGFDGVDAPDGGLSLANEDPFYLGQFTHYNFPISVDGGAFGCVDLSVTIPDLTCADGSAPDEGSSLDLTYEFCLQETPNVAPCDYPGSPDCSDRVTVSTVPEQTLTCSNDGEDGEGVTYLVQILGFSNNADCETDLDRDDVSTSFVTDENQASTACLWARSTDNPAQPAAVTLAQFDAQAIVGTVEVTWETVSEVDNLGFNLYRSEAGAEDWTQLNDALIPGTPGATAGQSYHWVDSTVESGKSYVYRLDAIDTSGLTEVVGTAQVQVTGVDSTERLFFPIFGAGESGMATAASMGPGCDGDCSLLTRIELQAAHTAGAEYALGGDVVVRDQVGRRLAGATVTVAWTTGDGESQMTAATDASGIAHFDYAGQTSGLSVLNVEQAGYAFDAASSETDVIVSW